MTPILSLSDKPTAEIYTFPYTTLFRSREEMDAWRAKDPIATYAARLEALGVLTGAQRRALERSVQDEIEDRKSTRLNSSHLVSSYAVFCLKKKKISQYNKNEPSQ